MSWTRVVNTARALMRQVPSGNTLSRWTWGPLAAEVQRARRGFHVPDTDSWIYFEEQMRVAGNRKAPLAQLVVTARGAVVQMSDGWSRVSREVLSGQDPLVLLEGGQRFDIVHFDCSRLVYKNIRAKLPDCQLTYFVMTQQLSDTAALLRRTRRLAQPMPGCMFTLFARKDAWFLAEYGYPAVNRFVRTPLPPDRRTYEEAPQRGCSFSKGKPSCSP